MTLIGGGWWLYQGVTWRDPGATGWLAIIIVLTVVSTLIARWTLYEAIQRIGSGQLSLLVPLETFITILWSIIFLQERLTLGQWLGGALVLLSAFLAIRPTD